MRRVLDGAPDADGYRQYVHYGIGWDDQPSLTLDLTVSLSADELAVIERVAAPRFWDRFR
jgi:hypothetical protein